jgi:2-C-methyl-D-erythritol 4-phosphate cytidylyltransferase
MAVTSKNPAKIWAVVPAAGRGLRMGEQLPKQYSPLKEMTVIEKTISLLKTHPKISDVVIVIHPDDQHWQTLKISADKTISVIQGGAERQFSIMNALQYLAKKAQADDWVLVHDAVRPCLSQDELNHLIVEVSDHSTGGILAVPVRDTLKSVTGNSLISHTVPRENLWQAQTPQLFRFAKLFKAYEQALAHGHVITDEASAIELLGESHCVVPGRATNIKITYAEDLKLARKILE